jgi:hypothetical protein
VHSLAAERAGDAESGQCLTLDLATKTEASPVPSSTRAHTSGSGCSQCQGTTSTGASLGVRPRQGPARTRTGRRCLLSMLSLSLLSFLPYEISWSIPKECERPTPCEQLHQGNGAAAQVSQGRGRNGQSPIPV